MNTDGHEWGRGQGTEARGQRTGDRRQEQPFSRQAAKAQRGDYVEWARRMAVNVAQGSGLREKEHATGAVCHGEFHLWAAGDITPLA